MPPRSAPLPGPWLAMKKVIWPACWAREAAPPRVMIAAAARMDNRNFVFMASPHTFVTLSFILAVRPHSAPHITALRPAPLVRFGIPGGRFGSRGRPSVRPAFAAMLCRKQWENSDDLSVRDRLAWGRGGAGDGNGRRAGVR